MTIPCQPRVSAGFNQPRPLAAQVKTHIHGAWDLAAPIGTEIVAPESGDVYYACFLRPQGSPKPITLLTNRMRTPFDMAGHYYWADIYGSLIILLSEKHAHILTHSYQNQLQMRGPGASVAWGYTEEADDERFPLRAFHTFEQKITVSEGEKIGYVGNAGFSTGPHIHYEIHRGHKWNRWEDRIDPATVWPKVRVP